MSQPYEGNSTFITKPGVKGTNSTTGAGIVGDSREGIGVEGIGGPGAALPQLEAPVVTAARDRTAAGDRTQQLLAAAWLERTIGVRGTTESYNSEAYGVYGEGRYGAGVRGFAANGDGVQGVSERLAGVMGQSRTGHGVRASSRGGDGVHAESERLSGVYGHSREATGVFGSSLNGEGIHGESQSGASSAVAGIQLNPGSTGAGVYGEHRGDGPAGYFRGNVVVTRDVFLLNADCAEEFDIADAMAIEPGTVVSICDGGQLGPCTVAYDKKVVDVISGTGPFRSAIVLHKQDHVAGRAPVALVGKVYCKVDASFGPIETGDLLTTSATTGHAMKAADSSKAFGAVIGKSLADHRDGRGLIPIVVALQ